ncbi:hypothetical protein D0Z70_07650 [Sphingobium terrigena]|uniref:Uncharacterized protein n=1 Tax=Sphingobium terrigena TaxID=2304063 RepID=A0A418YUS7_9SPHN|nr:hypothetical protein D0Z70_07650 [Sphingobium terrigena]
MLRRRSLVEQRVIHLIRGEAEEGRDAMPAMQFARLRDLATRNVLVIHRPGTPYLSPGELTLLGWLALAQRIASYRQSFHPDPSLTMTVVHCAGTLDALGVRLHLSPSPIASCTGQAENGMTV